MYKVYQGNIVPEENTIFVFGSNPEGRHGAGSAKVAKEQFGAIYGQGEGLQGNAYALPTTELRYEKQDKYSRFSMNPNDIVENIKRMYQCAREHPDKNFKVAYRNRKDEKTLCGYTSEQLMELFKEAVGDGDYPDNVWFSQEWADSGYLQLERSIKFPKALRPYQERMLVELKELEERTSKLNAFLGDREKYIDMPLEKLDLLVKQYHYMSLYEHVLRQRCNLEGIL